MVKVRYFFILYFLSFAVYKKTKNQVTVAAEAYNLDEAVENAFDDEVREAFRLGHLNFGVIIKFINAS